MTDTPLIYTGIGSRNTPEPILHIMVHIASTMAPGGWFLRTGFAAGADQAFGLGVENALGSDGGGMINYLPWPQFNDAPHASDDVRFMTPFVGSPDLYDQAQDIASQYHPAWHRCSQGAKKMHTRNVAQLLGEDLQSPSRLVIGYTNDGKDSGGTGQTFRMARGLGIEVFNLYHDADRKAMCNHVNLVEMLHAS